MSATPRHAFHAPGFVASVSGDLAAVDVQGGAGDERRPFEIEDPVDDVADLSQPAKGGRASIPEYDAGSRSGVLMTASATELTRTPRGAYSMAGKRATASRAALREDRQRGGRSLSGWSTTLVLALTMAGALTDHLADGARGRRS